MSETDGPVSQLRAGMKQFLTLVAEVRPELHRYAARMTGSIADGEDIVQDTLSRAYYALSEMEELPALRPWLFRIAHHRALDHLGRYERRMSQPLDEASELAADGAPDPEDQLAREQASCAALVRFLELAPAQRSAVILKDVLGHSCAEIAELTSVSELAVKAALHRGRERLKGGSTGARVSSSAVRDPRVERYAALFNARDWDGVRALLAEDVRLDLVSRSQRSGRRLVSGYLSNYDALGDWYLEPGELDGRTVVFVRREPGAARPGYFIELRWEHGAVVGIRDFRYVPYILEDLARSSVAPRVCGDSQIPSAEIALSGSGGSSLRGDDVAQLFASVEAAVAGHGQHELGADAQLTAADDSGGSGLGRR